jgi:hypothetical protein
LRIGTWRRLTSGSILAILITAMVSGCSRLGEEPSPTIESPAASPAEPTPAPSDAAATPEPAPMLTVAPTATPGPHLPAELEPVAGTVLPIAVRGGGPGVMTCNGLGPFTFETLRARPAGAEDLEGPEYDVLRATIERYGDDPEFAFRGVTFREAYRDATRVSFLGDLGYPEGPFSEISVAFDGSTWKWAGMDGGCALHGDPGPGWAAANWELDPGFRTPTSKTRKLHLLVREQLCDAPEPVVGRLAPAFVFFEPNRVRIQLFIVAPRHARSCEGLDPTGSGPPVAVSLTLPEPLGPRDPEDATPRPCPGCGG